MATGHSTRSPEAIKPYRPQDSRALRLITGFGDPASDEQDRPRGLLWWPRFGHLCESSAQAAILSYAFYWSTRSREGGYMQWHHGIEFFTAKKIAFDTMLSLKTVQRTMPRMYSRKRGRDFEKGFLYPKFASSGKKGIWSLKIDWKKLLPAIGYKIYPIESPASYRRIMRSREEYRKNLQAIKGKLCSRKERKVWVPHLFSIACGGKLAPSIVLSQLAWHVRQEMWPEGPHAHIGHLLPGGWRAIARKREARYLGLIANQIRSSLMHLENIGLIELKDGRYRDSGGVMQNTKFARLNLEGLDELVRDIEVHEIGSMCFE